MAGKRNQTSPIGSPSSGNISDSSSKEQDRFLPIANVSRIMKKSLPANAKISKEAKETVQECVSEFISFITGEASDKCQKEKRKTINGDDLLWAMTTLGFENYVGPLKVYLNKYRETEGEKNSMARQEDHQSPPPPAAAAAIDNLGNEINKVNGSVSTELKFLGFNGTGFYSLGAQVTPTTYGENSRFVGHGHNLVDAAAFNMNSTRENGDANSNRPMAAQIHHGVEW
ncbi:hypothetical protein P3X46_019147 [Hevea brasiliensis]|uniref:Transcription factor CBF/NF-Y/archaeal histone domain-containing protein n=1 Tax=Hevea brasiliensis TaxID=3981 RepID=A0ABQ9LX41_HEVBR|nr:nuclear transcription factor Y subunit B-3 [Hevea brasiliensis]KAJ9171099.1 hypothetical protein P3X46_019147 [Hevea brasiliensis]